MARKTVTAADYRALAEFRYRMRVFMQFSEDAAREAGLPPAQHQALLAIKGFGDSDHLAIGKLAEKLKIRNNSAVELSNRMVEKKLIERRSDPDDQRRVLLYLTDEGNELLERLSLTHLDELVRLGPLLNDIIGRN